MNKQKKISLKFKLKTCLRKKKRLEKRGKMGSVPVLPVVVDSVKAGWSDLCC